jgi:uroporphyrinogen decarboxylase
MTSRERILAALNHEETERLPIDFGSSRSSGINAIAYIELKNYLGINKPTYVYDVKQLLAMPDVEVLERFGVDVVQLPRLAPSLGLSIDAWKEGTLPDGSECFLPKAFEPVVTDKGEGFFDAQGRLTSLRPKGGLYFDELYSPLKDAESVADVEAFAMPRMTDAELSFAKNRAKVLFETTDFAISAATSFSLFEKGTKDFGYENFLVNLHAEPEMISYYLDRLTDAYMGMFDAYLGAVGDYIHIVQTNDDFGMQTGGLISRQMYRDFFMPRHARIIDFIKRKSKGIYVFLHACGGIYEFMGDMIEAGFDAFNPVQTNAANMDPVRLKREFGKKCTFWGGACNTQTTMTFGSVADVVREAEQMISIFAPNGGFVFTQVHNIQPGVSAEKTVALYDTALRRNKGGRNE